MTAVNYSEMYSLSVRIAILS